MSTLAEELEEAAGLAKSLAFRYGIGGDNEARDEYSAKAAAWLARAARVREAAADKWAVAINGIQMLDYIAGPLPLREGSDT